MTEININTWNRKALYEHFIQLKDPYFGVVIPFDVTKAYSFAKANNISFFGKYLHDCMMAINNVDNLRYRIIDKKIIDFKQVHASATIMRNDNTFGFSFIHYHTDLNVFLLNLKAEKQRIQNSKDLFPPINGENCIHCSALPWYKFTGHKEPSSGKPASIPELAFSKVEEHSGKLMMNVAIHVNHALVDGYHLGIFSEIFQNNLNR